MTDAEIEAVEALALAIDALIEAVQDVGADERMLSEAKRFHLLAEATLSRLRTGG